jgi:type II secretory pathway component GspD/PulD (secretin)
MRTIYPSVAAVAVFLLAVPNIMAVDEDVASEQRAIMSTTRCYRLSYVSAREASEKVAAVITGPKIAVSERDNTLLATGSELHHSQIAKILEVVDYRPATVSLKCSLVRVGAGGERTTISKPQVITRDGQKAMISVSSGSGETFELEITPSVEHHLSDR